MFGITPSARLRPSPYFEATLKEGVTQFTTYNHMLMPTSYGKPEAEYWRLINRVSQRDVAVERQVQLKSPDAGRLAQILAPRDLSKCQVGQGKYVDLQVPDDTIGIQALRRIAKAGPRRHTLGIVLDGVAPVASLNRAAPLPR